MTNRIRSMATRDWYASSNSSDASVASGWRVSRFCITRTYDGRMNWSNTLAAGNPVTRRQGVFGGLRIEEVVRGPWPARLLSGEGTRSDRWFHIWKKIHRTENTRGFPLPELGVTRTLTARV